MNYVTLNDGTQVPSLGMGTWYLGEGRRSAAEEERALRAGIEAGITLIDTAEMYGDGAAEELLGRAIRGYDRDELFLVSKVYPHNAGRRNIFRACEDSLRRMGVDCLDLYLLHWRGSVPLQETVDCMEELIRQGRIARWGVSNLDLEDMEELFQCDGGDGCAVNQVLYHLGSRGTELLPAPLDGAEPCGHDGLLPPGPGRAAAPGAGEQPGSAPDRRGERPDPHAGPAGLCAGPEEHHRHSPDRLGGPPLCSMRRRRTTP